MLDYTEKKMKFSMKDFFSKCEMLLFYWNYLKVLLMHLCLDI